MVPSYSALHDAGNSPRASGPIDEFMLPLKNVRHGVSKRGGEIIAMKEFFLRDDEVTFQRGMKREMLQLVVYR